MSDDAPIVVADAADLPAHASVQPPLTAAHAEPPAPELPAEPDADSYVPVAALHAVRQENRGLKDSIAQANAQIQQLHGLQQQVADLSQRLAQSTPPPAPAPSVNDDEARAWAIQQQIYKTDGSGQPDLDAAKRSLQMVEARAREIAQQAVAPVYEQTARDRSQRHREQLSQLRDPAGRPIDPRAIDQVYGILPPEITSNPNAAIWVAMMAAGAERFSQPAQPQPAAMAPVYSERAGGRPSGPVVTDFEARALKATGRDLKQHAAALANFKPGEPNALE